MECSCPNCFFVIPVNVISSSARNDGIDYVCPGCKRELFLDYFERYDVESSEEYFDWFFILA